MFQNFKLTIEYDGTNYCGWQRQPNGPSIQATIESALETMTRQKITLIGSGRTDAGVHALGQTASFACDTLLEPATFQKGLNSILPPDIAICQCVKAHGQFHARYDAKSKRYRYCIVNAQRPMAIGRHYVWWIRKPIDVNAMQTAAGLIVGEHDFKSFEAAGSPRAHTRRHVTQAQWGHQDRGRLTFDIQADGFLRYMVRNIVGSLVAVGLHKISVQRFEEIFESRDRALAAPTAPAQGLFLVEVFY